MEIRALVDILLDAVGVRMIFQPKYSPELNPCEHIFGHVKKYLREQRGTRPFLEEIALGFTRITKAEVVRCYYACLERYHEDI
jgi:transposase